MLKVFTSLKKSSQKDEIWNPHHLPFGVNTPSLLFKKDLNDMYLKY